VSNTTWEGLRWAYDKRLTYQLAAEQQVDYPSTIYPTTEVDLEGVPCTFPAILNQPRTPTINRFTADKPGRANREELLARYREARG